ncbi:MAG: oxygen-independent coproporphyrinogen III oxidase, partial [Neisseriaceae bacterium]|nr:oxygen-independent coproporphyrinogen III oxidase [Neisseriaceae bacterium]
RHADIYINYLDKETQLLKPHLTGITRLEQLHFGGGTPTFLSDEQLGRVFEIIGNAFELVKNGEYSIEIDPRKVSADNVRNLAKLGFNRMSVGVQDFDHKVQVAVNRVQSVEETAQVVNTARESGFKSVSIDLIYGLPHQSVATMKATLDTVLTQLDPDRISLYHYAHLPHLFKPQRRIDTAAVPNSKEKLDILQYAVQRLTDEGYIFIGMDHFAKPQDELSVALRQGRLQRNFQGYSTHADCDLIGLGISSIGKVGNIYCQNVKTTEEYYAALDSGHLPVLRGYTLNKDDLLRRNIIQDLMCRFALSFLPYEQQYGLNFEQYFATEMAEMKQLQQDGLVEIEPKFIWVTDKGRFLIRNIAMVFDYHLRHKSTTAVYSKTV